MKKFSSIGEGGADLGKRVVNPTSFPAPSFVKAARDSATGDVDTWHIPDWPADDSLDEATLIELIVKSDTGSLASLSNEDLDAAAEIRKVVTKDNFGADIDVPQPDDAVPDDDTVMNYAGELVFTFPDPPVATQDETTTA